MELQLYSIQEVCGLLKISRTSLYEQATRGRISLRKIGAKTVVSGADLKTYIDNLPRVDAAIGSKSAR